MVAIAVLSVVVAVAIPGYQTWLIVFGGVLVAWAKFGLLTE
jgi:Tfp pilus assembly major pilin PilA